jgi:surface protein
MKKPFIFKIKIDKLKSFSFSIENSSDDKKFLFVEWGDGNISQTGYKGSLNCNHLYDKEGEYTIKITGDIGSINFKNESRPCILEVIDLGDCNWTSFNKMFSSCYNLTSLAGGVTKNVTDMSHMFVNAKSLVKIDLSSFDTSSVTNMSHMFCDIYSIAKIDLSSFNTSSVTNMRYMFCDTYSLVDLDLSSFNTSNVLDMSYMFHDAHSLTSLDLSKFDTSSVTNMNSMFCKTRALGSLNLSSFITDRVADFRQMLRGTNSLISLDLYGFSFDNGNLEAFCENGPSEIIVKKRYKKLYFKEYENIKYREYVASKENAWLNSLN